MFLKILRIRIFFIKSRLSINYKNEKNWKNLKKKLSLKGEPHLKQNYQIIFRKKKY